MINCNAMKHKILALLFLLLGVFRGFSQTTVGTDFWVGFLSIWLESTSSYNTRHSVWVCALEDCTVTMENPITQWSQTVDIAAGSSREIVSPVTHISSFGGTYNGGFHLTSTAPVTVYELNWLNYEPDNEWAWKFEACSILPTASLSDEYYVQDYRMYMHGAEFVVVATEDNTVVDITPTCFVDSGNHPAGETFVVTLNAGQVFDAQTWLVGATVPSDYTKTHVVDRDGKKIVVLGGNSEAAVPYDSENRNHAAESMFPLDWRGRYFMLPRSVDRNHDYLQALPDPGGHCKMWRDGEMICNFSTLSERVYETELPTDLAATYWETQKVSSVYHFMGGDMLNQGEGWHGPAMTRMHDISRVIDSVAFVSFEDEHIVNFVDVVALTDSLQEIRLDGDNIADRFETIEGNPQFSIARIPLEAGTHVLKSTSGGFTGRAYGFCDPALDTIYPGTYSYDLGVTRQRPIASFAAEGDTVCQNQFASFSLKTCILYSQIAWDFGDGTSGEGETVSHQFEQSGDVQVVVTLYDLSGNEAATFTKNVFVRPSYHEEMEVVACGNYVWNGINYSESGIYEQAFTTTQGCDSVLVLHLTLADAATNEFSVTTCDNYVWNGTVYSKSGDYEQSFVTSQGCDSIVTLHLTINDAIESEWEQRACESFSWNDEIYDTTGDYTQSFTSTLGCDSIVTLHLIINDAIETEWEQQACESFSWNDETYYSTGDYTQLFTSIQGCDSIVTLHLTIDGTVVGESAVTACESYDWNGAVYSESGDYEQTFVAQQGCDSVVVLHLTIVQQPSVAIAGDEQIACSTNLWTGLYSYSIDSTGIDPSDVHWALDRPDWVLEPRGASCDVIAYSAGIAELRVWLENQVCAVEASKTLKAAYFDVPENEADNVKVYPNPARSEVTIDASAITRIRIVDALGRVAYDRPFRGEDSVILDISDLPQGVFVVEVATEQGRMQHCLVMSH